MSIFKLICSCYIGEIKLKSMLPETGQELLDNCRMRGGCLGFLGCLLVGCFSVFLFGVFVCFKQNA